VKWKEYAIDGQIANISLGGVLVTEMNAIPPTGVVFTLLFNAEARDLEVIGSVFSRVVRTASEIIEGEATGWIGVQFEESPDQVQSKLAPLFQTFVEPTNGAE